MPVVPASDICITAFNWVPDFARGHVRDLRVRWALEEAGRPYRVRTLNARAERPADYYAEQPFGQVPSYRDGEVELFESGAIVLHVGATCEALLPDNPNARARAIAWTFAALNSVEPFVMQLATIDIFSAGEDWAALRRPAVVDMIAQRLQRLSDALGDRCFFEDRFTAGDLLMTSVLRSLDGKGLIEAHPNLVAWKARCEARTAFKAALAAQLANFADAPTSAAA